MVGELQGQAAGLVLTLHGELDLNTVDRLRDLLDRAAAQAPERLVVDLSDVRFVDVCSLSAILAAADSQRDRGGSLVVSGASRAIRRVCALLNAEDILVPVWPRPRVAVT